MFGLPGIIGWGLSTAHQQCPQCGYKQWEENTPEDNWIHRTEGMRCETCMWFVPKEVPDHEGQGIYKGRCRRHCPTMGGFPVVFNSDWCGDHKLA